MIEWINRKWYIHKMEYKLAIKSLQSFLQVKTDENDHEIM